MGLVGSLEPSRDDFVSELLMEQLGSSRSFKREKRKCAQALFAVGHPRRAVVSELYSPPRVTKEIVRMRSRRLAPGLALDFTVIDPSDGKPWDFNDPAKRERARMLVRRQRPYMLIGSPMCRAFSTWQFLNKFRAVDPQELERTRLQAIVHIEFMASLYLEQIEGGRYFLHEHPAFATSWALPCMEELAKVHGVEMAYADQCQYGQAIQSGRHRGDPVKKPTGFLGNSPEVAKQLSKRCTGTGGSCSRPAGGQHRGCSGSHAQAAAIYTREMCRAVIKGISEQLRKDGTLKRGCYGVQVPDEDEATLKELYGPAQGYSGRFRDDLSGQVLRDDLVHEARAKELEYFHSKGVWVKAPVSEARRRTGRPPVTVRWVDVNKGDELVPKYRSRLVARQMKALDSSGQSFFAPAPPPIEALRTVVSMAMTRIGSHIPDWEPESATRTQLSFIDVSRAYFNAVINEQDAPTYVALPAEEKDSEGMCGRLLRHMYGTRMAADGWQEECSSMLVSLGCRQGTACPNAFYHKERGIQCSVHGDDFTSSGPKPELDWL